MKCCDVRAADLRHSITIETPTETRDNYGGSTVVWATNFTAMAKITPMTTAQVLYAKQLDHRVTHKILIRYRSGVNIDDRVIFGSRTFHIRGFRNLEERNRFLEIEAEEGSPS